MAISGSERQKKHDEKLRSNGFLKIVRYIHPSWSEYFVRNSQKWRKPKPGSENVAEKEE